MHLLTRKQLADIQQLQLICEEFEPIELKLNWDMLKTRNDYLKQDFFHYENGMLVGFIGLYGFGQTVEVCGMVHPHFRRKGIFTRLYQEALTTIEKKEYKKILFNAPSQSETAKGFLQTIPCVYSFSEHQMKWKEKELTFFKDVKLKLATPTDLEMEVQLDIQCFGVEESDAKEFYEKQRYEYDQHYMIEVDDKAVGKLRVSHNENKEAWIYGFAILPAYQGQGIGRKALTNIVLNEHLIGFSIFLEVEANNANALRLYESCGFKAFHSQDYYEKSDFKESKES